MNIRKYAIGLLALLLGASTALAGTLPLRQATASQARLIGPFVDTDGAAVTGLTIDAADVRISVNGGNIVGKNSGGCTHDELGMYACTFDATDTATVGSFQVIVSEAGALIVKHDFVVLEEAVYDRDYAASATGLIGTAQTGDSYARLGAPAGASIAADIVVLDNFVDDLESRLGTPSNLGGGATVAANLADIEGQTDDIGAAGAGLTAADDAVMTRLGAPVGASLSADLQVVDGNVDDIETDTADMQPKLGTFTDFGSGTSTLAANLQDMADNGTATFDRSTDSLQAIRDRGDAAWSSAGADPYDLGIVAAGTAQSATSTTIRLAAGETFADDEIIGATVLVTGGSTGVGQSRLITDYVSSTDTATVETWTTTPTGTITYNVFGTAAGSGGSGLDAAGVRSALGMSSANLDTQLAAIDDYVDTEVAAILVDTGTTLDDLVDDLETRLTATRAGYLDNLSAGAVALEATAQSILTDTGTTLQGEIDGIQADTEDLQSRIPSALVGGRIDATVDGTGMESGAINAIIESAFTYNATADYAGATTGSLVKEIADNAGGSALTTDAIAEAMFTFNATATYATADAGSVVKQIADNAGGSALTVEAIRAEMDSNSTQLAKLGTPAGASISADIAAIEAQTDDIGVAGAGLTAADDAVVALIGTPAGASLSADVAVIEGQTDDIGAAGAGLTAADDATLAAIAALNNLSAAAVNAEVDTALADYDPPTKAELDAGFAALLTDQRIILGTCDSGSTTTCVDNALTQADATQLEDRLICFEDGWCALITTFTPASDTATTTKVAPSTRASKAYTIFPATLE